MIGPFSVTGEETSYAEWFLISILTCALSYPIFFIAALWKFRSQTDSIMVYAFNEAWRALIAMLMLLYVVGSFVVGITVAIGSNVLKFAGVPGEYFDLNLHPWFFYSLLFSVYGLWYLSCLIYVIRKMPWSR